MIENRPSVYSVSRGVKGNTYKESLAAISPCIVLLLGHGTHLIWTLTTIVKHPTSTNHKTSILSHPELVYYSGAIVGAIIAARFVSTTPKKVIYTIAAILTLAVGVLYLLSKYDSEFLITGLFLAGSCYGATILTALIHAPEIASHEDVRHEVILTLGMAMVLSFVVPALILKPSYKIEFAGIAIGVLCLIQGCCVLLTNIFYVKESPSFILQHSNMDIEEVSDKEAYSTFKIHQDGIENNPELLSRFSALKSYVTEEKRRSRNIFEDGNVKPLLACIAIRFFRVLTFKFYSIYTIEIEETEVKRKTEWIVFSLDSPASYTVLLYFVSGSIATYLVYKFKERAHQIAVTVIIVEVVVAMLIQLSVAVQKKASKVDALHFFSFLFLVYCLSMPLDFYGMIHLSEAFNLSKKPYSIGLVLVFEYLVVLHTYSWLHSLDQDYAKWFIIVGVLVFGAISLRHIPSETKNITLEQCPAAYENACRTNQEHNSFR